MINVLCFGLAEPFRLRSKRMNKKSLTEADIRTKFITPALVGANSTKWNVMTQIREEAYFTKGRVIVRGKTVKRGESKKADYLLPRLGGHGYEYHTLVKAGDHQKYFETLWPKQAAAICRLIDEMKTWKTERCERFATLYAAWNDLIMIVREPRM